MRALLWLFVFQGAGWAISRAQQVDPEDIVRQYLALHQIGDVDGLSALHSEDSEFVIPGQDPVIGRAALRDLFSWDAVLETRLIMEDIRIEGDTIIIDSIVEQNNFFRALGLPEVRYRPGTRLVLRDGQISGTYATEFEKETQGRVLEELGRVVRWLSTERPEVKDRLLPNNRFRYDGASAKLWLQALDEWNRSQQ